MNRRLSGMGLVFGALSVCPVGCGTNQERYGSDESLGFGSSALSATDSSALPAIGAAAASNGSNSPSLSATRDAYLTPRDFVAVAWKDFGNQPDDWVAIAPEGSSDAAVTMRVSTGGRDGAYAFGPLPAGTYRARYFSDEAGGKTQESEPIAVPVLFLNRFQSISAGGGFSCGITPNRRVRCWGAVSAVLRNVTLEGPATVVPEVSDAVQISSGTSRVCALLRDATVRCWGAFRDARSGGGPEVIESPITIDGLENVVSVAAGHDRMCAILRSGKVSCGDRIATEVEGISDAVSISLGNDHTCVVLRDNTVRCWGDNQYGQVGDPLGSADHPTPFEVAGVSDAVQVKAGWSHTCILRRGGTVQCWGDNTSGQLGDGTFNQSATPVTVIGLDDAVALSLGDFHSCALTRQGKIRCWGSNYEAQLGDGTLVESSVPVDGPRLHHVVAITAGGEHTCALRRDGETLCWGRTGGAATEGEGQATAEIGGFGDALALTAGSDHTCALTSCGRVLCWGTYDLNEVPEGGSYGYRLDRPAEVRGLSGVLSISGGGEHSCAVLRDGTVRCWGAVGFSQSRTEYPPDLTAIPIPGLPGPVAKLSAGWDATCALLRDGQISCWGENDQGQRGDGTDFSAPSPTLVSGISDGIDVNMRWDHACAVLSDGTVRCWGSNALGQLGNDSVQTAATTPVPVIGVAHAVGVGTTREGTCALVEDGTVSCWGNGTVTPKPIPGITNAIALSTGTAHACAKLLDGRVLCWGSNEYGQLGTGTRVEQSGPVQIGGVRNALIVASGGLFTCVLHNHSRIRCWGYGGYGQFGNGRSPFERWPSPVYGLLQ